MKITVRYKQSVIAACVVITCILVGSFATSSAQPLGAGNPGIELVKVADPTTIQSGDTVVYTYGITNTGDVPLVDITLSDDKLGDIALVPQRVTSGLQLLYTFEEGSGTTVYDVSGVEPLLHLTVEDEAAVDWVPGGGLSINSSTIVASASAATKVIDACKGSNEVSIEAWVKPANATQGPGSPVRIVTLSDPADGAHKRNFTLGQEESTYDVRLRTTATDDNGIPSLAAGTVNTEELSHVVYTRDASGVARFYVDGVDVGSRDDITGDFSNWSDDFRFALANEFDVDRTWLGELRLVSVYDRALSPAEVTQNFEARIVLLPGESITATASADLFSDTTNTATATGTDPDGIVVSAIDTATVTVTDCGPGVFEPDDVIDQANKIVAHTPQCHYFEEPYDEDWVKFWAWAGVEYTIETFELSVFNDTDLWLYDANGTELEHNTDYGGPTASRIDWVAPTSGTYFVKVTHEKGWGGGDDYFYFLQVIESYLDSDAYEPDNTMAEAKLIAVGTEQAHTFHGACGGDVDWVKFEATPGTAYTIQTLGLSGDNDTVLRLYNVSGEEIASDDDDPDYPPASRIDWTAITGGTYFVEVVHFNRFAGGGDDLSYSLKVATAVDPPGSSPPPGDYADGFEPDDHWYDAQPIKVNAGLQERNFDVTGDEDWVKFWAFAGNEYTIATSDLPAGHDTELYLYDADVEPLAYNDDVYPGSGDSLITWLAGETGAYFIRVKHPKSEGGPGYTYSLEVTSTVPCIDDYEEDDAPDQAKPITVDSDPQFHNFHVPCICGDERAADEVDWVWFQAEEGVVYTIETSGLGGGNDTLLELYSVGILYDPGVEPEEVNDDYDADNLLPSKIVWQAPDDGKYYVKVLPFDDRNGGCDVSYDLQITTNKHALTIIIDGPGSVTKELDKETYRYGETVTLTATPDDLEYGMFVEWSGDLSSADNPVAITMNSSKSITATFVNPGPPTYYAYLPCVIKSCPCRDEHEPDEYDYYLDWPGLEPGETTEGWICEGHPEMEGDELVERDWYWFTIDTLQDIEVDLVVPDTVNYDLFLWVGEWVRAENTGLGVDEHIDWSAKGIGYYVVVVKSLGDADNCTPYELTVTLSPQ
ncbi:MAG: pre-peptidase C-terminal domain-containing protein [Chloroflexota bacterium]|nr:pre-peptidase C-terminal domain-containing protein [Chloroflexota bacterium]